MQILPPQIDRLSMLMQEGNAKFRFGVPFGGNAGLGCPGHFLCHFKTVIPILMPLAVNRDKPIKNFKVIGKVRPADIANAFIQGLMGFGTLMRLPGKRLAPQ